MSEAIEKPGVFDTFDKKTWKSIVFLGFCIENRKSNSERLVTGKKVKLILFAQA